ncbi:hypothetical protein VST7929_01637 [Vibrio stylophorae]|uniref:Metallo-beta-lactamase domain-containing protein n=2 Tax=Vibrio stylophorae TaxID=659351 RepID=A0ABN8DSU1_9VIBR|nr:hypothetical protein VST7929_01637 [Vibrio stylophorae]
MLSLQWWPSLPEWHVISLTAIGAVGLLVTPWRRWSLPLLVFIWTAGHGYDFRQSQLELDGLTDDITIQGTVTSLFLPSFDMSHKKHVVMVALQNSDDRYDLDLSKPQLRLYFNTPTQVPRAGELWQFDVKLRPIVGRFNDGSLDRERWAVGKHLLGQGRVLAVTQIDDTSSWRQSLALWLTPQLSNWSSGDLMLALVMGERGLLTQSRWQHLKQSGLVHLVAISGLHIGFALAIGWQLGALLRRIWPSALTQWWPLYLGAVFALAYAALAGFSIPTQRALLMATLVLLSYRLQWRLSGWTLLSLALFLCLLRDPLSSFDAGLWLSFGAVSALYWVMTWWRQAPIQTPNVKSGADGQGYLWWGGALTHCRRYVLRLLQIQALLFVLMLPMQWLLFGGVSWLGPLNNALAIPWVGLVVAPLIMLLVLFLPWFMAQGELPHGLLQLFDWSLQPVIWLSENDYGWMDFPARMDLLLLGLCLVAVSFFFWGGRALLKSHSLWFAALVFWLVGVSWPRSSSDAWQLVTLDVGHGLAMVLVQGDEAVLYDVGAAWPQGDVGQSVIIPWLNSHQLKLRGIVVSHDDNDHRGGLRSVLKRWPMVWMKDSQLSNQNGCRMGEVWQWQALSFQVLWPPQRAKRAKNQDSCVLWVSDGHHDLLLTGDLDAASEYRMLAYWQSKGRDFSQVDVLQVPHHGSKSASTSRFLTALSPQIALNSAARYSPWRLPHPQVVARYHKHQIQWLNTAQHGQIRLAFRPDTIEIDTRRQGLWPRWYRIPFGPSALNE